MVAGRVARHRRAVEALLKTSRIALTEALEKIVKGETHIKRTLEDSVVEESFPEFMQSQGFDSTWRRRNDFRDFMAENDSKFSKATSKRRHARPLIRIPFNSMAYPIGLMVLLGSDTGMGSIYELPWRFDRSDRRPVSSDFTPSHRWCDLCFIC